MAALSSLNYLHEALLVLNSALCGAMLFRSLCSARRNHPPATSIIVILVWMSVIIAASSRQAFA
jgi:hypothetical protein